MVNRLITMRRLLPALLALALQGSVLAQTPPALGEGVCGGFPLADNGPHDYRLVRDRRLSIVEKVHFTSEVERLVKGATSQFVAGDLGFTLRAFPNHHRALIAMVRLGEKLRSAQPPGSIYSIECWLDRAVRFTPGDAVVRMVYANYLKTHSRTSEALEQLKHAIAAAGESAFTHYNAGLIYLEMKQYDLALAQAHLAYGMGFQRPELRDRLKSARQWKDPVDEAPAAAVQPLSEASGAASAPGEK